MQFLDKVKNSVSTVSDWAKSKVSTVVAVGFAGAGSAAQAAAVDVSAVTTDIAAQAAPIAAVGVAVLIIYGGVKAFRWVRAALS